MAEKPPAFVVVDKRKFTAEGEIREGFVPPEPEPVKAPPAAPEAESPAPVEDRSSAKVVTMPPRTPEAATDATSGTMAGADDLREEEMAGSVTPFSTAEAAYPGDQESLRALGGDFGGDFGGESDAEFAGEEPVGMPRSHAETSAQHAAYLQSSRDIDAMLQQANPGMQSPGEVRFEHVVQSFYLSAIMAMGAGTEPGQKPRIDILAARQSIDMLTVLEEKTRGNLSDQEQQLLQGITFELRMMFLELTNAISKQAHQPGVPPQGGGSFR